ncbi:MAG: hypothetical protein WC292_02960 [Clostridia bacterium]
MRKKFDYILLVVLLAAVLVTGIIDKGVTGGKPQNFDAANASKYISVSYTGGFGGGGVMNYNCYATNISNFDLKNIQVTVVLSTGSKFYHNIAYLKAGEKIKFEVSVTSAETALGLPKMPQISDFDVEGDIVR